MQKAKKVEFFNKKARFDYDIIDSFEVGIILTGKEIRAIRGGRVNMTNSYAKILHNELFWLGGLINIEGGDSQRTRKLLAKKEQIVQLISKTQEKGLALVPIKLYVARGKAKIELGIARGKKKYEKRAVIKNREDEIEVQRKIKDLNR